MFPDRVEVVSPGGLPFGVTVDDYLAGNLSILRNPILAGVLFRLNVIEQFGTGIRRIRWGYVDSRAKPRFDATEGPIGVTLTGTRRRCFRPSRLESRSQAAKWSR